MRSDDFSNFGAILTYRFVSNIIETRFENSSVRRSKLGVRLILEVFGDRNVKFEA